MKYKRSTRTVTIEPEDTIAHLAQVSHSTVDEWIVFLESMINEELQGWPNDKSDKDYRPGL